jgi:hypothetical protein
LVTCRRVLRRARQTRRDPAHWSTGETRLRRVAGKILKRNSLLAVCQMPDELFQPFAAAITPFVVIEKSVPHTVPP